LLTKRIIPCFDVYRGQVVKGVRFKEHRYAGDPVELAARYMEDTADEIVFLDIAASPEGRGPLLELVTRTAESIFIPLTVGGGVRTVEDFDLLLRSGADKVSVNTGAVENPVLLKEASERFGAQCVVLSIDALRVSKDRWEARIRTGPGGGMEATGLDVVQWARKAEGLGAGEILLNSIDSDGTRLGYDVDLLRAVSSSVNIPVIASGGAGSEEHIYEALTAGGADAALAASIFHYGLVSIRELKRRLAERGVPVRL